MTADPQPPVIRNRRALRVALALGGAVTALAGWWWLGQAAGTQDAAGGPAIVVQQEKESALFGLTKLHAVHLTIPASEWNVLQTDTVVGRGGRGGGFGGANGLPDGDYTRPSDGRMMHRGGGFGGIFPWVSADLSSGDTTLPHVGLRYKGNASYTASQNQLRRNLKVKTDFYGKAAGLAGEKTLDLNAGALDPSRIRESLSFSVFRAAGIPAPRTAYAEVTLAVPGRYEDEFVGLYTLVEQVNKSFAKEFLPGEKGLLLKPEGLSGGIAYYGEDWARYDSLYRPEREPTDHESDRVIAFARLVGRANDDEFRRDIASYLEVEEFLRYVAVNALLVNLDSYLGGRHNFYVYLNPLDDRFLFIPWDQDLSLGSFGGRGGTAGSILDLSLLHPYSGQNRLIERTLAIPHYRERYLAIVRELVATVFSRSSLLKTIDALEATTRQSLAREASVNAQRGERPGQTGFGGMAGRGVPPREFVEQRLASVQRQLDGQSEGTIPSGGFGGGRGLGPPGARGGRGGF